MIAKLPWPEKVLFQICREAHAANFAASGEFSWRGYNTATVGKEVGLEVPNGKRAEGGFFSLGRRLGVF
jgi:hypothetical protein